MTALIIIATVIDLGLAVLLIAVTTRAIMP